MNNIKQLIERYFSKELRLYSIKSKGDLISKIVDVLSSTLPEDINEVIKFSFNFDNTLPLENTDFYVYYKGLETNEEYKERLVKEEKEKDKENKLNLLSDLAKELGYNLEKINE